MTTTFAVVKAADPATGVPGEQHPVLTHDAEHALVVDRGSPVLASSLFARAVMRR
jgi:hypothetical protein